MTNLKPKVSIHIISFNQKDYIAEAIESAVTQDYENLEVVVSDDASTDGTAEIISEYKHRYPDRLVVLLNKKNFGITRNANRALRLCSGKYIAFQGGDDVLLPGKISAQVAWLEQDDRRVLCGHQVEVFYQNNLRKPHLQMKVLRAGQGPEEVIRLGVPYGATSMMVKAEKIPSYGFNELLPTVSDHMLWIDVLMDGGFYGYVKGVYARYRRHDSNVTNHHYDNLDDVKKMFEIIAKNHPQYAQSCDWAFNRHITYYSGVLLLKAGRKVEARKMFVKAIANAPFFVQAWIRLAQTFLP